ncbi:ABC transporter ATP-binding protein [Marinobacter sp. M216]|uniref:ABC transporter ATP-binding protein n=1 Tax=Marinobacter albus TaxID=3030833 RepID=A0ABT7HE94_9GAMM|nr:MULTISPECIES: ABC transporter ATP-binding protein [unclassified Marinobacter]MBW7469546.1 ABC transporter ATP-binding protein [Marinobacter sp. F4218]MDK9558185.1 ABC transporter ATP-binding protein [Marinobacter sp. M216]
MTDFNAERRQTMLRVDNLTHRVSLETDTLTILQGVSLEINRGESVAIVGRSGSGKTTLLGLLAGLDTPSDGTVELDGSVISKLTEDERAKLRARRVGFVFQSFQLLPALTARENVMLPLELAGMESPEARARELLERVGLGERLNHTPRQLSGGEQQRVAIARAFASDPVILFADEPTGNLDNRTGQSVSDLLMELNREQGTTLVMVTHDEHLAARCGRQFHIEAGILTEPEAARELAD